MTSGRSSILPNHKNQCPECYYTCWCTHKRRLMDSVLLLFCVYFGINRQRAGRESAVGIATRYELDGPGIESRWGGEIFHTRPDRPCSSPSLLYNRQWVFSRGGEAAGARRCPPTPSSAEVKEKYIYTSTPPHGLF